MKATYLFPIATALLIVVFYAGLPALRVCRAPQKLADEKRGWRSHWFILALTLVYTVVAFVNLGNVRSAQTCRRFDGESAVFELETPTPIGRVLLYAGIAQGDVTIEFSPDGSTWLPAGSMTVGHASVLKWEEPKLDGAPSEPMCALRLTGYSGVELIELGVFSPAGEQLALTSSCTELCDEQDLVPDTQYFLNSSYFDEIYHARTAWEHLRGINPYEWTHPPLGKTIISLGIALFGMTPFGWRFMGTLFGVAMLPVMYWFARKLYGGKFVPNACAVLLATDFMHFAQTRIATIDTFGVFFILLMYGFMYEYLQTRKLKDLALSGVFFGFGAASKWTCLYAGAGLGVLWLIHWLRQARAVSPEGVQRGEKPDYEAPGLAFLENVGWCLIFFVGVPMLIYYLAYIPYGHARGCLPFSGDYTALVIKNQGDMFNYHKGIESTHPYASRWYQWMLDIRPVFFYLKNFGDGTRSSFGTWLNPLLCWAGLLALPVLIYMLVVRRDRKAGFLLWGYLAQLLPWVLITRTTYEYHYFPCSMFLILALGYVFGLMRENTKRWKTFVTGFCVLSALLFVLFYPATSGLRVNSELATKLLKWLPTWPY
ncbi:MAG: glycosyltransferase family 39 protein [Oscillospiraceae bacterium]|nr:glycosyltransferase family 39 protein [Oscillospiraceae bacterium]